jgi:RecA-family ATPase
MDKPQQVETLSFSELRNKEFPPDQFLVGDGLLPKNGLLFIGGPPKSYKSFVMQTMVIDMCVGRNLFGANRKRPGNKVELAFAVEQPQRILFLEQEIGFYDIRERILPAYEHLLPSERARVDENLFIHSRDHTMMLDSPEGCKRIEEVIQRVKPTVVCFDPLIEFHTADENSTQDMAKVLHHIDILRNTYGFATIISHHTGKPNKQNPREGPDLLRGNSVIFGKGDAFLMLTPVSRNNGTLKVDFTIRRSKPLSPMELYLDWTELRAKFHKWGSGKSRVSERDEDSESVN